MLSLLVFHIVYRLKIQSVMLVFLSPLVLLPLYLLSNLPNLSLLPKVNVRYIQTVCGCGGGGGWGALSCVVGHILQAFYTLFLTRFRPTKLLHHPQ
jgi:hypothetical protein